MEIERAERKLVLEDWRLAAEQLTLFNTLAFCVTN